MTGTRTRTWRQAACAIALVAGVGFVASASCTCSQLCDDDPITEVKSRAGRRARLTLRGCGATAANTMAVYVEGDLAVVIDDTSPVELRWEDERLVVIYSAAVPIGKVFLQAAGSAQRLVLVRR